MTIEHGKFIDDDDLENITYNIMKEAEMRRFSKPPLDPETFDAFTLFINYTTCRGLYSGKMTSPGALDLHVLHNSIQEENATKYTSSGNILDEILGTDRPNQFLDQIEGVIKVPEHLLTPPKMPWASFRAEKSDSPPPSTQDAQSEEIKDETDAPSLDNMAGNDSSEQMDTTAQSIQALREELQRDRIVFSAELQRDRLAFREEVRSDLKDISDKMTKLENTVDSKLETLAARTHQDNRTTLWAILGLVTAIMGALATVITFMISDQRTEMRRDIDKQWDEIKSIQQAQPQSQPQLAPIIIQVPAAPQASPPAQTQAEPPQSSKTPKTQKTPPPSN